MNTNITAEQKKKNFEDLLEKQEQERQLFKEQKKKNDEQLKDPREKILTIQKEFRSQYDLLQNMLKQFNKETSSINEYFLEFKKLKDLFLQTNYALTTFDKQQYKEQLEKLEKTIFQAKEIAQPRTKFRFSQQINKNSTKQNQESQQIQHFKDFSEDIPGFSNIEDQKIIVEDINNNNQYNLTRTCKLLNIKNSQIFLNDIFDTIYIKNIKNSQIFIGPVKFSVLIDNCENSELSIASHQIRIHNSKQTVFNIFSTSKSIIENCTQVNFKQYNHSYLNFEKDFYSSGMKGKNNLWQEIQDFDWLKQEKSPNFTYIYE
ncbi:tubulin-specific chaperone c, putative [Ichthyophthirius multifiliis]|uniref:Tubulin-specific chaperone c, putative n=1 Tax=Ichthyophthirius multifiliis TaxID=5932 RepID=G0R0L8_ICHMU|nr:tubulin-specific chaperone c, putative [Ichthyophthirius multifiliis]EGR29004.1 tubulin-specific chaperone c, putative [Ichthyophthirius multifiliis]|eukprot:XP_004030240.1 tubulin-specific chaperone c, putative [Ichthyophthirius multifiliis]